MDLGNVLGYLWMMAYPIILSSSFVITVLKILGIKSIVSKLWLFSSIFICLMFISFVKYSLGTTAIRKVTLLELFVDFYQWGIYGAFYYFLLSSIIALAYGFNNK